MTKTTKLTRRGWIVLVVIPTLLLGLLFAYATRDLCYVGTDKSYANALGYGSCKTMLDDLLGGM
jgi:hypothetical protein